MFARLLVLFVVVPLVELYLLYRIALLTNFPTTVGLVLFTGILGAWLAKQQGLSTLHRIQRSLGEGNVPGDALLDGAMILFASALLLTPGVLTDLFGFSLLFPPCRVIYRRYLKKMSGTVSVQTFHGSFRNVYHGDPADGGDDGMVQGSAKSVADESLPE